MAIRSPNSTHGPIGYNLAPQAEGEHVLNALASMFPSRLEQASDDHFVYLDTFDWRLFKRGMRLALHTADENRALRLETNDACIYEPLPRSTAPRFAGDLPAGRIHDQIAPIIAVRRLLPRVEIETKTNRVEIGDENKVMACVQLIQTHVTDPEANNDQSKALDPKLQVAATCGDHPATLRRITRYLEYDLGLDPATHETFQEALEIIGHEPSSYRSKPEIGLEPTMTAGEAALAICRTLLDTLLVNEAGVRRDLDMEFLHDFRVAGRRTRSILALIGKVFEPQSKDHFREEFKWLGSVTGPVRDLDVHLLRMNNYRASLPEAASKDLAPLGQYLRRHRSTARRRLTAALRSKRYHALVDTWRAHLDGSQPELLIERIARQPVMDVASKRIWQAYRRVEKRANAIGPDSSADVLHKLRIECKKLRYLLELFYSLYDSNDIDPLIKALKRLQKNLGDFNDLVTQEAALRRIAHEMEQAKFATVDCLLAMGQLLGELIWRQHRERRRFAKCFARFNKPRNRKRFRQTFKTVAAN
ncbi:CYTH and CHAD domain-containing protein [Nitrococcus mobilis]|uniref:CYTH and CHAD domain-containing protein n=1 Tax=Nitrococcus mobilis TaxID=35797 RepID=UPI0012E9BDE4|nr:CHAD domain-containing protein [Nitrococcus mobilis]